MKRLGLVLLLGLVLAAVYFFVRGGSGVEVTTAAVERGSVSENLDEDGIVKSDLEAELAPRIQGRLARVLVKTGQHVRKGQLLASLEQADLEAAVAAARANEQAAAATVEQARAQAELQRGTLAAELSQSQAARDVAAANLSKVEEGARPQDRLTARRRYEAARASEEEARANYKRNKQLFEQGYVSAQQVEATRTALGTATANRQAALAELSSLDARRQDLAASRGELERAVASEQGAAARQGQVTVSGWRAHGPAGSRPRPIWPWPKSGPRATGRSCSTRWSRAR